MISISSSEEEEIVIELFKEEVFYFLKAEENEVKVRFPYNFLNQKRVI